MSRVSGVEARPPSGVDVTVPNLARMNDYFFGGKDNFAADREAAEEILQIAPEIRLLAQENRAFTARVVEFLADQGIEQYISIGNGLPTECNTHGALRAVAPDARLVYVEHDPVVLTHARALIAGAPRTLVVKGHVLRPKKIITHPDVRELLDFSRPIAVLIFGVLHFYADEEDPFGAVATFREALAPGGYLALSHVVFDARPATAAPIVEIYQRIFNRKGDPSRHREDLFPFFDGLELADPGLVDIREWRTGTVVSGPTAEFVFMAGGVGLKRA
jgi:S-adenosyl methyltransferase